MQTPCCASPYPVSSSAVWTAADHFLCIGQGVVSGLIPSHGADLPPHPNPDSSSHLTVHRRKPITLPFIMGRPPLTTNQESQQTAPSPHLQLPHSPPTGWNNLIIIAPHPPTTTSTRHTPPSVTHCVTFSPCVNTLTRARRAQGKLWGKPVTRSLSCVPRQPQTPT